MGSLSHIADITTVVLDVDGVLTDGRIGYGAGPDEIKYFNVLDGHRIKMAMRAGLAVGILSGRKSRANETRAKDLGMSFIIQGCHDKRDGWERLLKERNLRPEQCLYMGDDVVDIPPMRRCGIAAAPANAVPEALAVADFRAEARGGEGAVREVIEFLLKGQGKWDDLLQRYYS